MINDLIHDIYVAFDYMKKQDPLFLEELKMEHLELELYTSAFSVDTLGLTYDFILRKKGEETHIVHGTLGSKAKLDKEKVQEGMKGLAERLEQDGLQIEYVDNIEVVKKSDFGGRVKTLMDILFSGADSN